MTCSPPLKMALSIDSRDSVSLLSPIQATRFLTFSSMGLPPTEHISLSFFTGHAEAQSPGPPMPLSTLRMTPHDGTRKTRGQDGFATSFPAGDLHPLQHAGLARRTPYWRSSARNRVFESTSAEPSLEATIRNTKGPPGRADLVRHEPRCPTLAPSMHYFDAITTTPDLHPLSVTSPEKHDYQRTRPG